VFVDGLRPSANEHYRYEVHGTDSLRDFTTQLNTTLAVITKLPLAGPSLFPGYLDGLASPEASISRRPSSFARPTAAARSVTWSLRYSARWWVFTVLTET
jgi:hypothetical protein